MSSFNLFSRFTGLFFFLSILLILSCSREIKKESPPSAEKGIIFVRAISTLDDFGIKPHFFKRIWRFITGGESKQLFDFPMDIDFFEDRFIAVADEGRRGIHFIDLKKKRYKFLDSACGIDLITPLAVTFLNEKYLALTDPANHLVCFKGLGKEDDVKPDIEFLNPVGLALDSTGNIIVVDSHQHSIFKLTGDGKEVWRTGGRGNKDENLNFPTFVAYYDGKIFIVDTLSYAVKIFKDNGEFLGKFGRPGDGTGDFGKPKGIAIDKNGNIHVADSLFDVVQVFDLSGNFLTWYGGSGEKEGNLLHPSGIRIINDDIYVVNSLNARIEVYRYVE